VAAGLLVAVLAVVGGCGTPTEVWAPPPASEASRSAAAESTWAVRELDVSGYLNAVSFPTAEHGWAVGSSGVVVSTGDGGRHWGIETTAAKALNDVCFVDGLHGWAVGEGGTMLATVDGGSSWQKRQPPSKKALMAVTFADSVSGWVVGDAGTILATTDGGRTWHKQCSGTSLHLEDVAFVDESHGWAVGGDGNNAVILATSDGGRRWRSQYEEKGGLIPFYCVAFSTERCGCAGHETGRLLTANGGRVWRSPVFVDMRFLALDFCDEDRGWAAGDGYSLSGTGAAVFATGDGGATWAVARRVVGFLEDVAVAPDGRIWAVGERLDGNQRRGIVVCGTPKGNAEGVE